MPGTPSPRLTYLGPAGTFAEQALRTLPVYAQASSVEPSTSVLDAIDAVRAGEADMALLPYENSMEGSVAGTIDAMVVEGKDPVVITNEVVLPVTFALLAAPGLALSDVTAVGTIGPAEAQCRDWLRTNLPGIPVVAAASTAEAAHAVATGGGPYNAAIAAPIAADVYGLSPLASDIGDATTAATRFVLVARPGSPPPPTGADRTTVVLYERDDHPGALMEMLTEFAVRGVNLTWLTSRPTGEGLGSYCFCIDAEGHVADARLGEALSALYRLCRRVVFLGSYPRADGVPVTPKRGTSDREFRDAEAWLAALRRGE
ncbi:MAG TPA: prephenate dehydratase [Mycobacteriales bacterium]|nr:prephenate dehydratase [Mycobacteriales bacterium]